MYTYTMQAIYTMYIIPLFDSFKHVYTVMTVCVCVCVCVYTVLHMGPEAFNANFIVLYCIVLIYFAIKT